MNCPTCPSSVLVIADRSGIEIDHCPTCRGVWLDRGELDKIIDRSIAAVAPSLAGSGGQFADAGRRDDDDDDDDRRRYSHGDQRCTQHRHGKKKKGFLGDLFDF